MNTALELQNRAMLDQITVVFSLSMSLTKWQAMGILEKEIQFYQSYIDHGITRQIRLFTYNRADVELIQQANRDGTISSCVNVIAAPTFAANKVGAILYSFIGPVLQRRHIRASDTVYSHQSSGAWTGLICKIFFGKRFIYRYGHSLWRRHLDRAQYHRLLFSWPLDRLLTRFSDYTLMCTKKDYLYSGARNNSAVCPNYIDTDTLPHFNPEVWPHRSDRAVFVGRLMPFKNLFNLIEACNKTNMPLDIYGEGPLEEELKAFVKRLEADCHFKGVADNKKIRENLPSYKTFFLVSTYEGMPKALLEGMASACLCIVSPHYGCTEIVQHHINGLICDDYSSEAITEAIKTSQSIDRVMLAQRAQQDVEKNYSLNSVIAKHRIAHSVQDQLRERIPG